MNKLLPGQAIVAIGMAGLGFLCIVYGDFIIGRPPAWPEAFHLTPIIGYVTGAITIIASLIMLTSKKAGPASLLLAILILLLSVGRHLPVFMNDWVNTYKALALFGSVLIISSSFFNLHDTLFPTIDISIKTRRIFVNVGAVTLGIFFIIAAYAHVKFAEFVIDLIPAYIPFHFFWTYFTAACLLAGGIGVIIPFTRSLASLLSGIMVMGWFLLLHIPRFIANVNDAGDRMGLCESFTFAGAFFVLYAVSSRR